LLQLAGGDVGTGVTAKVRQRVGADAHSLIEGRRQPKKLRCFRKTPPDGTINTAKPARVRLGWARPNLHVAHLIPKLSICVAPDNA
jgi:hypothetical protein